MKLNIKNISSYKLINIFIILFTLSSNTVLALEYRSVASDQVILFDTPSSKGNKKFILTKGYPVEILVNLNDWVKVRDGYGELSWIESKQLSEKRMVLALHNATQVRQYTNESSKIICDLAKDVVLHLVDIEDNWAKVEHESGCAGYVMASSLWGL